MSMVNQQKIVYSIQSFITFLNIAQVVHSQDQSRLARQKEKTLDLLEQCLLKEIAPEEVVYQLNQLIEELNQWVKAPYPSLITDTDESIVKGEIVAFEHYLNQELKANHLTIQQEAPLFNDSLRLWEKVGVTLSAKEGMNEFVDIIKKVNRLLPNEDQYPIPDLSQY